MAVLTARNLPDEVHRALRLRAADHGRSTEAEVGVILEEAVRPGTEKTSSENEDTHHLRQCQVSGWSGKRSMQKPGLYLCSSRTGSGR
jgi:plasmid stability protein